jgi:hypothetical protein
MKIRVALWLMCWFAIIGNAYCQTTNVICNIDTIRYTPKVFNSRIGEKSKPFSLLEAPEINTPLYAPKSLGCNVHYEAFFCRMELKITERLPFWIRVHAGDYDSYSQGSSLFK